MTTRKLCSEILRVLIVIAFGAFVVQLVNGCASLTPEQQYEMENARIERHEEILTYIATCLVQGGSIRTSRHHRGFDKISAENIPRNAFLGDYECVRYYE